MSDSASSHGGSAAPDEARAWAAELERMELVVVTHVVDAITFWAQNVTGDRAPEKIDSVLAEKCPTAPRVVGKPCPQKLYGACYSEDSCWYRCRVQQHLEDKFLVSYVDYGNTELINKSDLVEIPDGLQSAALAKKYRFWSFRLSSEQDSQDYLQGKSFLNNLINGKQLRINKKSVCFDGTILVQAFQGNLDIGEKVLKFKFAKVSLPFNRETPLPGKAFQNPAAPWSSQSSQADCDNPTFLAFVPKLRPVFSSLNPQTSGEKSSSEELITANDEGDGEQAKGKSPADADADMQQMRSLTVERMLNEDKMEMQKVSSGAEVEEKAKEIEELKEEKAAVQQYVNSLEHQLQEARLELQKMSEGRERKDECVEVQLESPVGERLSRLAEKVLAVRKIRDSDPYCTVGDLLWESITCVINNQIVVGATAEKLNVAWEDYQQALRTLRERQSKGELEDLLHKRNEARSLLLAAIDGFVLEVDKLPISERLKSLQDVSSSLSGMFGLVVGDDVEDQTFEQFCEWRKRQSQKFRKVRQATDDALSALSALAAKFSKFLCVTEKTEDLEGVAEGVDELFTQAECALSKEMNKNHSQQKGEEMIISKAFNKVMLQVQKEEHVLRGIQEIYDSSKKFRQEMLLWQNCSPKPDKLLNTKKRIRSLRSQLRWKQVEVGCLEEADELDLMEIVQKKEEIAETRNALFQEIKHEQEEYIKLSELVKGNFPELLYLYPEADISSYTSYEGLVRKSLDRDMFDAEPMRELSGRRPLVCTEFQDQKVVLKSYTVNEELEARMLEQAAHYHRAQRQSQTTVMPLIALFFGKSDPLAYLMLPYFSNGSLGAVQRVSPLLPSEIGKVMKGVLQGLQCLHEASITHASLNINNVFVLNRVQGIVGDYDFTKAPVQRAVHSVMMAGSLCLLAPELKLGHPPSPASDMYAFGCLLLWLHAPGSSGTVQTLQHISEFSQLQLDLKVQTLLSKLLVTSGRLTANEALLHDYFVSLEP